MIRFQFFPRSQGITSQMQQVVDCFIDSDKKIPSSIFTHDSNTVLEFLRKPFEKIGFKVEKGKSKESKVHVPVLFGLNNQIDKSFNADAVSGDGKIVIEVEAGRAVANNQFLKDIFQASMMFQVEYLVIAVRNEYRNSDDFSKFFSFLETL
jgi:intein/homing endonuclease